MITPPPGQAHLFINWHNESALVPCQYNPTELQIEKRAQYTEIGVPGLANPITQFVRGDTAELSAELFFDTSDKGTGAQAEPVTDLTDKVYAALLIDPELHTPPSVIFKWGKGFPMSGLPPQVKAQGRNSFTGFITSVRQSFTFFSRGGVPLRARLNVTIREFAPLDAQLRDLRLASPDRTHGVVLQSDETLAQLAARQYGRAEEWRRIADENGVSDPRRLEAGRRLSLPSIPIDGGRR